MYISLPLQNLMKKRARSQNNNFCLWISYCKNINAIILLALTYPPSRQSKFYCIYDVLWRVVVKLGFAWFIRTMNPGQCTINGTDILNKIFSRFFFHHSILWQLASPLPGILSPSLTHWLNLKLILSRLT